MFSKVGFFSAVQKSGDDQLTLRARASADLDRLRDSYLPTLGETIVGGGSDYPFRARAPRADFALAMLDAARDIDYANFKNTVAKHQGPARAHVYGKVWSPLLSLEGEGE